MCRTAKRPRSHILVSVCLRPALALVTTLKIMPDHPGFLFVWIVTGTGSFVTNPGAITPVIENTFKIR